LLETFYLHLEVKTKSGGWSVNLPFVCNKCGICCTLDDFLTAGKIKANPKENPQVHLRVQELYDEVGKIWEDSEAKYEEYITHSPCPFLINKTCSIYDIRPEGCRQFPNTSFGMETENCEPLDRFKKQRGALKKGRTTAETYHFMNKGRSIKPSKLSEKQYKNCIEKLRQIGITKDELCLFESINKK
jgi:Fe-S-cluster containining protein